MEYIDTNIIVRYLTKDDPEKAARAYGLLQEVERGERTVTTLEAVIAEVIYVLSSKRLYNLSRSEVAKRLLPVLMLKGLRLGCRSSDKTIYAQALHLYATTTLDFADALILAKMQQEHITIVVSFDTDFDHFPGIIRREPKPIQEQEA